MWVNEAQVEMNRPPCWGYIAATPGKVLTLKVSASVRFLRSALAGLPTPPSLTIRRACTS